jgi:hypothetical protein
VKMHGNRKIVLHFTNQCNYSPLCGGMTRV